MGILSPVDGGMIMVHVQLLSSYISCYILPQGSTRDDNVWAAFRFWGFWNHTWCLSPFPNFMVGEDLKWRTEIEQQIIQTGLSPKSAQQRGSTWSEWKNIKTESAFPRLKHFAPRLSPVFTLDHIGTLTSDLWRPRLNCGQEGFQESFPVKLTTKHMLETASRRRRATKVNQPPSTFNPLKAVYFTTASPDNLSLLPQLLKRQATRKQTRHM